MNAQSTSTLRLGYLDLCFYYRIWSSLYDDNMQKCLMIIFKEGKSTIHVKGNSELLLWYWTSNIHMPYLLSKGQGSSKKYVSFQMSAWCISCFEIKIRVQSHTSNSQQTSLQLRLISLRLERALSYDVCEVLFKFPQRWSFI